MRTATPSLNTLLSRGVLALLLLFAQQHAVLHWLSHSIEATHAKAGTPTGADHCDECLGLAAMGAGATSSAPLLPLAAARHAIAAHLLLAQAPQLLRLGFHSRAPPILS